MANSEIIGAGQETARRAPKKYKTIVADPPWPYVGRGPASSKEHRPNSYGAAPSSVERYGSMSIKEISELAPPADVNAHLYLWTTNSFLVEAHEVARSWGFVPKTLLTWGKIKSNGEASRKTGYYFRSATEHCLFAVRGSMRLLCKEAIPTLFLSERLPHSVKPQWFFDLVEKVSPSPRLEMFCRRMKYGWDCWGNDDYCECELELGKCSTSCAKEKCPAQNTKEICHTAPNSASPKAAQISMELEL